MINPHSDIILIPREDYVNSRKRNFSITESERSPLGKFNRQTFSGKYLILKVYESRYIAYLATSGSKRETTN